MALAVDIGCAGLALGIQAVEALLQTFFGAFPAIDRAADLGLPLVPRPRTGAHCAHRRGPARHASGGISSPAGSCVWHVVGLQRSVREWAMRQGWGGRPVDHKAAAGILIAALGVLAAHLGYGEVKRAS
jgi:hypothetical protein